MKPALSVIIPSYRPVPELLARLYESLLRQSFTEFEVIVVDDASPDLSVYNGLQDDRFRIVRQEKNCGPAASRNRGVAESRTDFLFFTDTDCELAPDTLAQAAGALDREPIATGNTVTRVESRTGRAIALLGFPGGGILGFDRVWRVDALGYARSFSSCNLAIRKSVFESLGRFDETFPVAGGEDTVLAHGAVQAGFPILYVPEMIIYHVEKNSLKDFLRWQITRGRGNYHIKRRVQSVGGYLKLRVWTFGNSLKKAGIPYFLPVCLLIGLSVCFQILGMMLEKRNASK